MRRHANSRIGGERALRARALELDGLTLRTDNPPAR